MKNKNNGGFIGLLIIGIIAVVIAGVAAYIILQRAGTPTSEQSTSEAPNQAGQKESKNRENSFRIDIPKTANVKLDELSASSLFEEQPVSEDGYFSLAKSRLDKMRQTIFVADKSDNKILLGYVFPRSSVPKTLTARQKELIEPYLYPNSKAIVINTQSTALTLIMTIDSLMTTTDTSGLIVEAVKFLGRDDFSSLVSQINQEFAKNPRGYMGEGAKIYSEINKFVAKTETPTRYNPGDENKKETLNYYDCGASDSCFLEYVKSCSPAKATIFQNGLSYEEKVGGFQNADCLTSLKYLSAPKGFTGVVGKEMTCTVPKPNLATYKDYLQGEQMKKSCKGSLIDFLNERIWN